MEAATALLAPLLAGHTVRAADAARKPARRSRALSVERKFGGISAYSPAMHAVFDLLDRLVSSEVTITLIGETGSGKDVLARALHETGPRAGRPFVVFDCGAVAPNLVESELFGHERGSFTGAHATHAGAFERAHGGTLFLDEIGELPLELQPRLLRVLDSRRVRRVGGREDRPIDIRVVAATNRDLRSLVGLNLFRQDLYFRLAAAVVPVPALRQRLEDLPLLLPRILADLDRSSMQLSEGTLQVLRQHSWPGNVRELKNTLASALAFVDGAVLEPEHLRFMSALDEQSLDRLPLGGQALERIERTAIRQTLAQTGGNKVQAAQALGIAVSTLYEKLKKYGL